MFGRISLIQHLYPLSILVITLLAIVSDLLWGKLYNKFNLPVLILGVLYSVATQGWSGLSQSLGAVVLALLLYGWIFWLRFLGGGDVKYLMALGSWGGISFTLNVAFLAILVGGAMALVTLLIRGKLKPFFKNAYSFLLSLFVKELEFQWMPVDRTLKLPFGIPISIAALWVVFFGTPVWL